MNAKRIIDSVLNWIAVAAFLGAGIAVLIMRGTAGEYTKQLCGTMLIIMGCGRLIVYLACFARTKPDNPNIISGLAMLTMGIVFLFTPYDIEMLCFGWGVMDIVLGAVEALSSAMLVRVSKLEIIDILCAAGGIAFGIILCIKLYEGLTGHIIFLGASFIVLGLALAVHNILHLVRRH